MGLSIKCAGVFRLPKSDSGEDEYEDASGSAESRFAVSDGATESSFAREWAQDLVAKFVESPPELKNGRLDFDTWLEPLQRAWAERIPWDRLEWNAHEKAKHGASAAFVGIEFIRSDDDEGSEQLWRVIALGDSCLFLVYRDKLFAFPLTHTSQFAHRPQLVSSIPEHNREALGEVRICEGICEDRDYFILATDALSSWFLHKFEGGGRPWEELISLRTQDEFACFINELRGSKAIVDDDVTLLIIQVEDRQPVQPHDAVTPSGLEPITQSDRDVHPAQAGGEASAGCAGDAREAKDEISPELHAWNVPFEDQSMYPSVSRRSILTRAFTPLRWAWRKIRARK